MENAQEELIRMEGQMIDSQLKEAEVSQQHAEATEQLAKAQADLQHFTVENNKLLMSLEEAVQKVSLREQVKGICLKFMFRIFVYLAMMYIPTQAAQLDKELQSLRCEREQLLGEKSEGTHYQEELESLRAAVSSVTEERNQLQEILQGLREERSQLKRDLEESNDMVTPRFNNKHDCNVFGQWT